MTDKITIDRAVVEQALKALERADRIAGYKNNWAETVALRAALEQPVEQGTVAYLFQHEETGYTQYIDVQQVEQGQLKGTSTPITDDNGKALRPQYRVIAQQGNWQLVYDQYQIGNFVDHDFRIQKLQHDIVLYRGISLREAIKRFHQKVEADHE